MNDPLSLKSLATDAGLRLDACLTLRLGISRARVGRLIKDGALLVNGSKAKPSMLLKGGEEFLLTMPEAKETELLPENIALDIIFSDSSIVVINKPQGLIVHPGAGVRNHTLCNALLFHFPNMIVGDSKRPGIVHRLDKDTSGLMVVAKTQSAHEFLSREFKERRVEKIYRAFAFGNLSADRLELKTGHMRHPKHPLKFFTGIPWPKAEGSSLRRAHTSIEVLSRESGILELKAILHTGRTHQIRAHLSDIGCPLVQDALYGGKRSLPSGVNKALSLALEELQGQALHAEELTFTHPYSKERMSFKAPLPKLLANIKEALLFRS